MVNAKQSPSKLIGYNGNEKIYETEVQYWMPFVGNYIGSTTPIGSLRLAERCTPTAQAAMLREPAAVEGSRALRHAVVGRHGCVALVKQRSDPTQRARIERARFSSRIGMISVQAFSHHGEIGHGEGHRARQVVRRHLDLASDAAARECDALMQLACLVDGGGEGLFHAERRAAPVYVAGQGQQLARADHRHAFSFTTFAAFLRSSSQATGIMNT